MKKTGVFMAIIVALMFGLGFSPALVSAKTTEAKTTDAKATAEQTKSEVAQKVDINKADAVMLTQIPGIGPKTADAIIAYRKDVGQFKSLEDLIEVKGIGPKKLEKIRPFLQKI